MSVSKNSSKQIATSFMNMLMSSVNECDSQQMQEINQRIEAAGDIDISNMKILQESSQKIACMSSQDLSQLVTSQMKTQLQAKAESQLKGIPFSASVNVSTVASDITQQLTSNTNLSLIQKQSAKAAQRINQNLKAGGDFKGVGVTIQQDSQQIMDGQASQVQEIISNNQTTIQQKSDATSIIDGMFSGSTFVYLAIVSAVVAVIGIIAKILMGKHETANSPVMTQGFDMGQGVAMNPGVDMGQYQQVNPQFVSYA